MAANGSHTYFFKVIHIFLCLLLLVFIINNKQ